MSALPRVLFVQDNGINESLALAELSAVLEREGAETGLVLTDHEVDAAAAIADFAPGLVVIPCPVTGHDEALRAARLCRQTVPSAFVLLGGTHVTFDASPAADPAVDAIVQGEAERAVVALLHRLASGQDWRDLHNLGWFDGERVVCNPLGALLHDLDELPLPDRALYWRYDFLKRFPWKKFSTGRGCVHGCSFCWNSTLRRRYDGKGSFVRRKSPQRAVAEIVSAREQAPLGHVHFSDDLFTWQPSWLEEFAPLYRRQVGIPFTANSSVELVTERAVAALAAAGCAGLAIGVETGNERLRSAILAKGVTNQHIREAAALIKAHGIELTTFNMLGSPGESLDDALDTLALNREIGADHVRVTMAVPVPNTSFESSAFETGWMPGAADRVSTLTEPDTPFVRPDGQAFRNLYYLFRWSVHHPELDPLMRMLLKLPTDRPLAPLRLIAPYIEKRIHRIGWVDGLRFFRHVGDPHKRTANYVTLI